MNNLFLSTYDQQNLRSPYAPLPAEEFITDCSEYLFKSKNEVELYFIKNDKNIKRGSSAFYINEGHIYLLIRLPGNVVQDLKESKDELYIDTLDTQLKLLPNDFSLGGFPRSLKLEITVTERFTVEVANSNNIKAKTLKGLGKILQQNGCCIEMPQKKLQPDEIKKLLTKIKFNDIIDEKKISEPIDPKNLNLNAINSSSIQPQRDNFIENISNNNQKESDTQITNSISDLNGPSNQSKVASPKTFSSSDILNNDSEKSIDYPSTTNTIKSAIRAKTTSPLENITHANQELRDNKIISNDSIIAEPIDMLASFNQSISSSDDLTDPETYTPRSLENMDNNTSNLVINTNNNSEISSPNLIQTEINNSIILTSENIFNDIPNTLNINSNLSKNNIFSHEIPVINLHEKDQELEKENANYFTIQQNTEVIQSNDNNDNSAIFIYEESAQKDNEGETDDFIIISNIQSRRCDSLKNSTYFREALSTNENIKFVITPNGNSFFLHLFGKNNTIHTYSISINESGFIKCNHPFLSDPFKSTDIFIEAIENLTNLPENSLIQPKTISLKFKKNPDQNLQRNDFKEVLNILSTHYNQMQVVAEKLSNEALSSSTISYYLSAINTGKDAKRLAAAFKNDDFLVAFIRLVNLILSDKEKPPKKLNDKDTRTLDNFYKKYTTAAESPAQKKSSINSSAPKKIMPQSSSAQIINQLNNNNNKKRTLDETPKTAKEKDVSPNQEQNKTPMNKKQKTNLNNNNNNETADPNYDSQFKKT